MNKRIVLKVAAALAALTAIGATQAQTTPSSFSSTGALKARRRCF